MKSSNPIFKNDAFSDTTSYSITEAPMTVSGTMSKLLMLFAILMVAAFFVYYQFALHHYDFVNILGIAGVIVGFISAIICVFKHDLTPYVAPVYAFAQGLAMSFISCYLEKEYNGIVSQAIGITLIIVFVMAVLFKAGVIKATEKLRSVIFAATVTIGVFYLIVFIMSMFGHLIPYFDPNTVYYYSPIAIVINVAIALVAALNLILDFDFIEKGAQKCLPAVYEWYGAFGLLVTVIWLYIEILKLLSRLRKR